MLSEGKVIGGYTILEFIGRGGMAEVYKVRGEDGAVYALKLIQADYSSNPKFVARFRREWQTASRLRHPNIVRMYAFGIHEGAPFYVMEYLPYDTLEDLQKERKVLPAESVVRWSRPVLTAMDYYWRQKVVHRDLKPANIIMRHGDEPVITDFGLVKDFTKTQLTGTGEVVGTPYYISPEMVKNHGVDIRSDIYQWGVICYLCLSGKLPFRGKSAVEVIKKVVHGECEPLHHVNPELDSNLVHFVMNCMAARRTHRYPNARAALRDLDRLEAGEEIHLLRSGSSADRLASSFVKKSGRLQGSRLSTASDSSLVVSGIRPGARRWILPLLVLVTSLILLAWYMLGGGEVVLRGEPVVSVGVASIRVEADTGSPCSLLVRLERAPGHPGRSAAALERKETAAGTRHSLIVPVPDGYRGGDVFVALVEPSTGRLLYRTAVELPAVSASVSSVSLRAGGEAALEFSVPIDAVSAALEIGYIDGRRLEVLCSRVDDSRSEAAGGCAWKACWPLRGVLSSVRVKLRGHWEQDELRLDLEKAVGRVVSMWSRRFRALFDPDREYKALRRRIFELVRRSFGEQRGKFVDRNLTISFEEGVRPDAEEAEKLRRLAREVRRMCEESPWGRIAPVVQRAMYFGCACMFLDEGELNTAASTLTTLEVLAYSLIRRGYGAPLSCMQEERWWFPAPERLRAYDVHELVSKGDVVPMMLVPLTVPRWNGKEWGLREIASFLMPDKHRYSFPKLDGRVLLYDKESYIKHFSFDFRPPSGRTLETGFVAVVMRIPKQDYRCVYGVKLNESAELLVHRPIKYFPLSYEGGKAGTCLILYPARMVHTDGVNELTVSCSILRLFDLAYKRNYISYVGVWGFQASP